MIPHLRDKFLKTFDPAVYQRFVNEINAEQHNSLEFRISESPLFLDEKLNRRLTEAAYDVAGVLTQPDFKRRVERAIPPGLEVAHETDHTTFLQVDFAICRDENGDLIPQLIEFQGFPSLYCYQHYLDKKIREHFDIPENFQPFYGGLDSDSYRELLGKVLLGDSAPENVVILEVQPYKQKTRIDFYIAEEYYGIKAVCVTEVIKHGNRLYYKRDGIEIPIERFYHRFIFDELVRKNLNVSFDLHDESLDVVWVGHPNWFFKISKFTLPLVESRYCPPAHYLHRIDEYPENLDDYVLKPLFSFAGVGVDVDVTREKLDAIQDRSNYLLQRKVAYTPFMRTPDGESKAEVRMMFIWDDEQPLLVNNLLRLSKGRMMGVDYNKNLTWVGSSLAYHEKS